MNTNENLRYINNYLNSYNNIVFKTKENKRFIITSFLNYCIEKEIKLNDLNENDVINYVLFIKNQYNYKISTIQNRRKELKLFLNWTFKQGLTSFSGENVCPNMHIGYRERVITSYNEDEIKKLLDSIDITNKIGKLRNAVMSMFIYYGIRVSDVVNLKFENINWENNEISIIQQKNKIPLTLPLIDHVKYPLLDYLKNSRDTNIDTNYIFVRVLPPVKKYTTSGIYSLIQKAFIDAKIDIKDKHHGPHSLRSSLATNMIKHNVSLGDICHVLGHSTTKTTEQYITKDTTHLKELALEVPYE